MTPFHPKRILAPTDFSDLATYGVKYAREIALRTDAELVVMYANPFLPPPHFLEAQLAAIGDALERSKEQAAEELARYAEEHAAAIANRRTMIADDYPINAIVNTSREQQSDLIVMGTHGRSGWNRFMMGSITERVLRQTDIPLLAVRPQESRGLLVTPTIRRILCPVDGGAAAETAYQHAVDLGRILHADVTVVQVVENSNDDAKTSGISSQLARLTESSAGAVRTLILRGSPAETLIEFARDEGSDLIVLGARHRRFADTTTLGATTLRVLRHAPCPVMTVGVRDES